MKLSGVSQAVVYDTIKQGIDEISCGDKNASFQNYIDGLQIKSDIIEHLKGVPLNTVTIPPNILEKMRTDQAAYTYYMNAIDEYVRGYQQYNCPGVIQMSFFITEDGEYCIRGENLILQSQIEASKKDDMPQKNEDKTRQTLFPLQQLSGTSQADFLTAGLATAYSVECLNLFRKRDSNS